MNSRERVLEYLSTDYHVTGLTAGEAVISITPDMASYLTQDDKHFFQIHCDDPCHEVAKACNASHIWHGDENIH